MGSSGVDLVFVVEVAAQVGGGTEASGAGMAICDVGRSANMLGVLSTSFGGRWAFSGFGA